MNFWLFVFYYVICTIFLLIVGLISYKIIYKKKISNIEKMFENQLEKYFDSYDEESGEIEKVSFDN